MSLPSDVTVNNFNDFYQAILPYLNVGNGGTSDTPLGQVAFFDDLVAPYGWLVADGSTYNISDYPDLANQYERVHGSKNYWGGNGTTTFAVPDWDAIPAEVFGNSNIICVKAVPSSEMNTYSTTERRVGTWIDGKPLYQKSFKNINPMSKTVVLTNVAAVIDWEFIRPYDSGGDSNTVLVHEGITNTNFVYIRLNNGSVSLDNVSGSYSAGSGTLTVRYTKTTD